MTKPADVRHAPTIAERRLPGSAGLRRLAAFVVALAAWLAAASGLAVAVAGQSVRAITWRRPVRAEFSRFLELATVQSVPASVVAGGLIGLAVTASAMYWYAQIGDIGPINEVLTVVIVREIAPVLVGFMVLGRSGLVIVSEVVAMRQEGQMRMLDAQGVDPFLVLILPRVIALTISVFTLTVIFIIAAIVVGHLAVLAVGIPVTPLYLLVIDVLDIVGSAGYVTLPLKTLSIGFVIGIVCAQTAMEGNPQVVTITQILPRAFIRSLLSIILISSLISVLS